MTCEELQKEFSPYLDDELGAASRAACDAHLEQCPYCRYQLAETRGMVRSLAGLARPEPPPDLASSIRHALAIEAGVVARQPALPFHLFLYRWLRPHIMPYTIGALTSALLFICMSAALLPNMRVLRELENPRAGGNAYVINLGTFDAGPYDVTRPLTPENYALRRREFSTESPSLNPRGALASLAWSHSPSHPDDDDEMVVVADVFSNGSAALADVVLPPRDRRMIDDVQRAFRSSPAFVPASLDHRPQTMRVVLAIQKMDVREQDF